MRITLYLDEYVPFSFAEALVNRGVNILTTQDAGNKGNSDLDQIIFAGTEGRVLLTYNKIDFIKIHHQWMTDHRTHSGIIVSDQLPIGTLLRRTMKLWFTVPSVDMENRLVFLSNWK